MIFMVLAIMAAIAVVVYAMTVSSKGAEKSDDKRTIELWTTKNEGQMIWSATSKTPEPNSVQAVRPEIVKLVMSELTKRGIIATER